MAAFYGTYHLAGQYRIALQCDPSVVLSCKCGEKIVFEGHSCLPFRAVALRMPGGMEPSCGWRAVIPGVCGNCSRLLLIDSTSGMILEGYALGIVPVGVTLVPAPVAVDSAPPLAGVVSALAMENTLRGDVAALKARVDDEQLRAEERTRVLSDHCRRLIRVAQGHETGEAARAIVNAAVASLRGVREG